MINTVALFIFPAMMALAASSDLLTMRISNRLVIALTAGFFVVALAVGLPPAQWAAHIGAAAVVLAAGFAFFAFGWIGGGDAKLAAATTLWLGFGLTLPYIVYAALMGGALTLVILALRRIPLSPMMARFAWIERLHNKKSGVPYGVALALAGLLAYSNSEIFLTLSGA